jgi:hypothetical protein
VKLPVVATYNDSLLASQILKTDVHDINISVQDLSIQHKYNGAHVG